MSKRIIFRIDIRDGADPSMLMEDLGELLAEHMHHGWNAPYWDGISGEIVDHAPAACIADIRAGIEHAQAGRTTPLDWTQFDDEAPQ